MAKIILIDDDAAAEVLAEHLRDRGHNAIRVRSVDDAFASIDSIASCDLVVLDLVMPMGSAASIKVSAHPTGMVIYRKLREISATLPIVVYTANQDASIVDVFNADLAAQYVPRWSSPSLAEFVRILNQRLGVVDRPVPLRAFIVHGRDDVAKWALKNYLQNTLKLPEPIILHEQPNLGRTIIEKFEGLSESVNLVFVLLTPDDLVSSTTSSAAEKRQARQNVIFEMGYFLGKIGRGSGRIFLLHKGGLELPSDISGIVYLSIDGGIEAAGEEIRRELNALKS